jgi:transcriptional regulator with XRE-family HTH domain
MSNTEILNKLTEGKVSNWHDKAEWRKRNADWLNKSAQIAVSVLEQLRIMGMSQKELADAMGVTPQYVNKVVRGNENLTLETICKIESILGISLIEIKSQPVQTVDEPINEKPHNHRKTSIKAHSLSQKIAST